MHCPNCGHTSSSEQKFCRACGMSLEKVVQLLSELSPAVRQETALGKREERLRRAAERAGVALFASGGVVLFITICWAIIAKIIIGKGEVLQGTIFLAIFLGIAVGGTLLGLSVPSGQAKPAVPPPSLPAGDPNARLLSEPHLEPVPSVTDRTTELLTVERRADTTEVN